MRRASSPSSGGRRFPTRRRRRFADQNPWAPNFVGQDPSPRAGRGQGGGVRCFGSFSRLRRAPLSQRSSGSTGASFLVLSKVRDELTTKTQRTQRRCTLSAFPRRAKLRRVAQALACTPQAEACEYPFFAVLRRGHILVS